MVKIILFAAVGLVVGLAGGTGVTVMRAPKPAAALEGAAADSAAARHPVVEGHGPVAPAAAAPAPAAAPAGAETPAHPPAETPAAEHAVTPVVTAATDGSHAPIPMPLPRPNAIASPPSRRPVAALSGPADFKRVSSILSNMKPDEAARILALLDDGQVEGILRTLGPRQAASVLAGLPAERAAALSRRLLEPEAEPR